MTNKERQAAVDSSRHVAVNDLRKRRELLRLERNSPALQEQSRELRRLRRENRALRARLSATGYPVADFIKPLESR